MYDICEALSQNREQVTFWAKWVFGIVVESTFSALIWYKNQVDIPPFATYDHLCT